MRLPPSPDVYHNSLGYLNALLKTPLKEYWNIDREFCLQIKTGSLAICSRPCKYCITMDLVTSANIGSGI